MLLHIGREPGGRWRIDMKNQHGGATRSTTAKFVYLGAGGGALLLLQKSGIPEGRGYGGFPVSGIWLRCDDADVNKRHHAKVYGKASVGSPPMSVPHLDTRVIGGKHSLLFGPYAGFSTKFLKHGSLMALFESIRPSCGWVAVRARRAPFAANHRDLLRRSKTATRHVNGGAAARLQRLRKHDCLLDVPAAIHQSVPDTRIVTGRLRSFLQSRSQAASA